MNLEGVDVAALNLNGNKTVADSWILTRLNETIAEVTRLSNKYEFGEVGRELYTFIWDDFCDWYIEMAKLTLYGEDAKAKQNTQAVLAYVLDQILRMLHPFMPFVTEEIFQALPQTIGSIVQASWPVVVPEHTKDEEAKQFRLLVDIIRAVRNIRAEVNTPMSKPIEIAIEAKNDEVQAILEKNQAYLEKFCNPSQLTLAREIVSAEQAMTAVVTGAEIILPLKGLINIEEEIARLEKELKKLDSEVERVQKKLSNQGFVSKAPAKVIEEEKAKEKDYSEKREVVKKRLEELRNF